MFAMAVLGYLPKLKTGLGLAFGGCFLRDFPREMFLKKTLWLLFIDGVQLPQG